MQRLPSLRACFFVVFVVDAAACSAAKLVGEGQPCFEAIECASGLACVPNNPTRPDAGSHCSADLSGVMGTPPGDGGMMMMMDGGRDASQDVMNAMDTGGGMDTSVPDVNMGMPDVASQ